MEIKDVIVLKKPLEDCDDFILEEDIERTFRILFPEKTRDKVFIKCFSSNIKEVTEIITYWS